MVARSIAGLDSRAVVVGSRRYVIHPPTIAVLARAGSHLADFAPVSNDMATTLQTITDLPKLAGALSVFIQGDEGLAEELSKATLPEVADALLVAYSMLDPHPFLTAVTLSRSVARMIANTRQ